MSTPSRAAKALYERKLDEMSRELDEAREMHNQQLSLRDSGSTHYSAKVHVAAMSQTVQSLYTRMESLIKDLLRLTGEEVPDTSAWHRDLLLLAATDQPDLRPAILTESQRIGLGQLLAFRHAVRNPYTSDLRHEDVDANVRLSLDLMPGVIQTVREYLHHLFGTTGDPQPVRPTARPGRVDP